MELVKQYADIIAMVFSALAMLHAFQSKRISQRALSLSEKNFALQFKELILYLVSAREYLDKDNVYYFVQLKISNPSSLDTSVFQAFLVAKLRSFDGLETTMTLPDSQVKHNVPTLDDSVQATPFNIAGGGSCEIGLLFVLPKSLREHGKIMQSKLVLQASDERKYELGLTMINRVEE